MLTLTESIQRLQTPELISSLAVRTGLSEGKVRTGMNAAIGAIMEGLASKAHDADEMADVVALIQQTPDVDDPLWVLDEDTHLRRSATRMLDGAMSDQRGTVRRLSGAVGIGGGTMTTLVIVGATVVMLGLRRFSRARGELDGSMLSSILIAESSALQAGLPAEMISIEERAPRPQIHESERYTFRKARRGVRRSNAWMVLLALIPVVLLGMWIFKRPSGRVDEPRGTAPLVKEASKAEPRTTGTIPAAPEINPPTSPEEPSMPDQVTQPDRPSQAATEPSTLEQEPPIAQPSEPAQPPTAALDFPSGSAEAMLLSQVQAGAAAEGTWLVLDAVTFPTASAAVPSDANDQLSHIALILMQNPDIKIEIGGHTDAPGQPRMNRELSKARADGVRQALIDKGIDGSRIEATGFGETDKVTTTSEEAPENRRVALRIIAR